MADLVLTVPINFAPSHFPWCAVVLREYLKYNKPEVDAHIGDLRDEEQVLSLFEEYRDCISQMKELLHQTDRYLGHMGSIISGAPDHYLPVMLKFGSSLFSLLQSEKIPFDENVRKRNEKQLGELKQKFESIIQSNARKHIGGQRRVVFGISIYDFTLFESLYLASVIRQVQDGVSIVIGGDWVDFPTAINIVERNKEIDGAVVGFGEKVLSDIMQSFLSGTEIRDMQLDGLVNAKTISRYLYNPDAEQIAAQQASIIRHQMPAYVKFDSKNRTIHVLARHGCGWGHCTFCKYTVKKTAIDANLTATKREIEKLLDELSVLENINEPVLVKLDGENNQIEFVVNLVLWLSSQAQTRNMKLNVWFWITVQQFNRDIAYKLNVLKQTENIHLDIDLSIESLNPVSLRNMKKGITPLEALKALKTLHDLGGKNLCFYFMFYPLDTLEGVMEEYYFMRNSLHLISAPRTVFWYNEYWPNNRDAISRTPPKYGIVLDFYNDIWLNKAFNVDLPCNSRAVNYSLAPADRAEGKIVNSWWRVLMKRQHMLPLIKNHKIKRRFPALVRLVNNFALLSEILRHIITQAVYSNFSYLKRHWIIINLHWWKKRSLIGNHRNDNRFPQFFLKDSRLFKKYPWPFSEKWSIELNPSELEVLRYLYEPRKSDDVMAKYKMKYSDNAINEILDKHLRLGSIVRHENKLMSIFHNPGYLHNRKD
ncbi:hypothetical protein ACFL55_00605 [Candidatus Latescibacterota bacterium]